MYLESGIFIHLKAKYKIIENETLIGLIGIKKVEIVIINGTNWYANKKDKIFISLKQNYKI